MKPTYMVIGAAKSGTTSLCALLGCHPDVFMTNPKETNYFAYDELYSRGNAWYEAFYNDAEGCTARGEGSPLYSLRWIYPDAPQRIAAYEPNLKLIYIARNPITRIEAGWLEMRSWGDETAHPDFNRALHVNREWLVDSTNYWNEIQCYRKHFPDDQILVLFFEDFIQDRKSVLQRCFTFLGVDQGVEIDESLMHLNKSIDKRIRRKGVSILRALPGMGLAFMAAKKLLPEVIRAPVRKYILNRNANMRPKWDAATRKWVVEQLKEDTDRFLEFYGKPPDFWNLEANSQDY